MSLRLRPIATLLSLALPMGCGSTVHETSEGGGGSAATTGSSASGMTDATSTGVGDSTAAGDGGGATTSTGGTGGESPSACDIFCDQAPQCAGDPSSCVGSCAETRPAECGPEFDALVVCRAPFLAEDCLADDICANESAAFDACLATASPTQCYTTTFGGEGACDGSGVCINGQTARMQCDPEGDAYACDCYVAGALIGTCTDPTADCDLENGCCADFF